MTENTFKVTCDVCGESFGKTQEHTVAWGDLSACSRDCKQRWINSHRRFE